MIKTMGALKQAAWTVSVMRSTTLFTCDKSHDLGSISGEKEHFLGGWGGWGEPNNDSIIHGKDTPIRISAWIHQREV